MLMDDHLARMAEEFGDRTAFAVVDVGSMTFAEWDGAANAMARRLVEAGLEPGGRVGIHLHPELALRWLVSYSAAHRAGGVAVPMNPRLAPAEVAHMLDHSGATAVVADGDLLRSDGEAGASHLVVLIDAGTEAGHAASAHRSRSSPGPRPPPATARPSRCRGPSEDLADILYTSGTTGRPKGVAVRHSNGSMIGQVDPNWTGAGWLHASPLFTFAGIALVYTPMKLGLQVIYQPRFDADRWLRVVEEERPMAVFLVPDHGPSAHRQPALRRRRPVVGADVLGGQRASGALRGGAPAGEDARRPGLEQLRHDRGRLGLLRHAQGRGGQAPGLRGPDRTAGRRAHRRRA